MKAEAKEGFEFRGLERKGQTEYVSTDAEYQFKVTEKIRADQENSNQWKYCTFRVHRKS